MQKPQIAALRVKIKSLAEECRIIKLEERRALGRRVGAVEETSIDRLGRRFVRRLSPGVVKCRDDALRLSLFDHRMGLRRELRAALLAYAFIRGKSYRQCEKKTGRHGGPGGGKNPPGLVRIQEIVRKFGVPEKSVLSKQWMEHELRAWLAGTLEKHPFAREVKSVA